MHIFLTGATGHVGSSVLAGFLRGGHDVTALVRDPEKSEIVSDRGARPLIGDLTKPATYASAAEAGSSAAKTTARLPIRDARPPTPWRHRLATPLPTSTPKIVDLNIWIPRRSLFNCQSAGESCIHCMTKTRFR